jgi:hypothetical protein
MLSTFDRICDGRVRWRRELVPVIAVAGLAADYLSPQAIWTMLLPFAAVVALFALRSRAAAVMVFLLSSWVLVPVAARVTCAVQELRGEHRMFLLDMDDADAAQPSVAEAVADPCVPNDVGFAVLPIGPGHLIDPHWALRDTIITFVELHNQILIARAHEDPTGLCAETGDWP